MFRHSTGLKAVTGISAVWYVHLFGLLLFPNTMTPYVGIELARCSRPACLCTSKPSGSDQRNQSQD